MVILGFFRYIWAQNAAPLANIAQGVCNNPLGQIAQSVLGQNATDTCNKVNLNKHCKQCSFLWHYNSHLWFHSYSYMGLSSGGKKTTIVDIEDIRSKRVSFSCYIVL
jgi:hypothetical protein